MILLEMIQTVYIFYIFFIFCPLFGSLSENKPGRQDVYTSRLERLVSLFNGIISYIHTGIIVLLAKCQWL